MSQNILALIATGTATEPDLFASIQPYLSMQVAGHLRGTLNTDNLAEEYSDNLADLVTSTLVQDSSSQNSFYDQELNITEIIKKGKLVLLERSVRGLIQDWIDKYIAENDLAIRAPSQFFQVKKIMVRGHMYKTRAESHCDCRVIFKDATAFGGWSAGVVQEILIHNRSQSQFQVIIPLVFFILRKYCELPQQFVKFDNYRKFPIVGGRIFRQLYEEENTVITPSQLISHSASTKNVSQNIPLDHIHILPLEKVSHIH